MSLFNLLVIWHKSVLKMRLTMTRWFNSISAQFVFSGVGGASEGIVDHDIVVGASSYHHLSDYRF